MDKGIKMKYFVLKPEGDNAYAKASRTAMQAYSNAIAKENPELSDDLMQWIFACLPQCSGEET